MTDLEAEASMGDVHWNMSAAEACAALWPGVRRRAGLPDTEDAPSAWRAALERLMDKPRPEPSWGGPRGEASSAYADDTHSGGWAVACVIKSLRRIALAGERATLHADPLKCKVLTALAQRPDLDAVLEPLRGRPSLGSSHAHAGPRRDAVGPRGSSWPSARHCASASSLPPTASSPSSRMAPSPPPRTSL